MRAALLAVAAVGLFAVQANAVGELTRPNVTSPFQILSLECDVCTSGDAGDDSVYCKEMGSGFVQNATFRADVQETAGNWSDPPGSFCWSGTFGQLLNKEGSDTFAYEQDGVTWSLACPQTNLYYNQCIVDSDTAVLLAIIGGCLFLFVTTMLMFICGCCKCCNLPGDESNFGMCKRISRACHCSKPSKEELEMMKNPSYRREKEREALQSSGLF